MMLRFACFTSPNSKQRSKKVIVPSKSQKTRDQEKKRPSGSASTRPKTDDKYLASNYAKQPASPSSQEDCWNPENFNDDFFPEDSEEFHLSTRIRKSQSLGCILDKERGLSGGDLTDDETDGVFPFNHSHEKNKTIMNDSFSEFENLESSFHNQLEENDFVQSFGMISDNVHHESLFSLKAMQQFDRGVHADVKWESADYLADFGSDIPLALARSQPRNNIRVDTVGYTEDVFTDEVMGFRCRSSENLHFPQESDEYDFHNYKMVANVGKENDARDVKLKNLKQESPILNCDEQLSPKELSMRRIQDWISQIGIEGDYIVEEPGESSSASFSSKEPQVEAVTLTNPTAKLDARSHIGTEVAHNYISSLNVTSSTAQMANLGLVAVPFLSAFVGLRVLNLSGNSIVHITAGALPRGLHMLNLSKNNIAAIEGLRDLTHLRVLDLSYNRIAKIGHGLASCSSLKELYLAGNMISEVEGLHRLLKLNVLDLRSNKIAIAKGLGNLAANYSSLQAINLDGNPAQRNVGDEQLKKYLLSLLPNLVYYNKHSISTSSTSSSMREAPERPTRSPARHFDRSPRTEHKLTRKGSHGSGLHKLPLNTIRPSPAAGPSLKQYKSRKAEARPLPLSRVGSKLPYLLPEVDQKPVSLQPSNPRRGKSFLNGNKWIVKYVLYACVLFYFAPVVMHLPTCNGLTCFFFIMSILLVIKNHTVSVCVLLM